MIDMDDLCELLTMKYRVDFFIIDSNYKILALSKGVNRLIDDDISIGDDIRDSIYELIGYEKYLQDIEAAVKSDLDIRSIYKNGFYIDINIREFKKKESFVVFIDDVTNSIEKSRAILQDRNSNELLIKELAYKNQLLDRYKRASKRSVPSMHLDTNFVIQDINSNFLNLLNYSLEDLVGVGFETIVHQGTPLDQYEILSSIYEKKIYNTTLELEKECDNSIFINGTFVPICDGKGNLNEIVLFAYDVTAQKQCSLYFEDKAVTDSLTNLLNRFGFEQKMDKLLDGCDEFALLFMDLNLFKSINDTYGHYFGDRILSEVGSRLSDIFDEETIIARYGGDEFIVVTKRCCKEEIEEISNKIVESISKEYIIDKKVLYIGISIGVSYYPKDGNSLTLLLRKADEDMYRVKRAIKAKII